MLDIDDLLGVIQGQRWLSRNPAWGRTLGWDDEELRHQPPTSLEHPDDPPVFPRLAALRHGETTSEALTSAALDRIDALNNHLGAFVHVEREAALTSARDADQLIERAAELGNALR